MKTIAAILGQIPEIGIPQLKFLSELFNIMFCIKGRYNFSNLARFSAYSERSFRRWFTRCFDFPLFNHLLISLLPIGEMIACIDASAFAKAGRKTFGKGRFWSGWSGKTISGIEISCIALVHLTFHTAFNLSVAQTDGTLKGEESRIDYYIKQFISVLSLLKKYTRIMVADGFYAKKKFTDAMLENGFTFISKLRSDANLRWLYEGTHRKRKGRKKKFDGKVSFSQFDRFTLVPSHESFSIYEAIVYSIALQRTIKIILLYDLQSENYVLLFSTDPHLDALTILKYYRLRFQIEFLFRDAKQHTGLTHCQSTKKESLHFHYNAALSAVNIAKFDMLQTKNFNPECIFSLDHYKRQKTNEYYVSRIISMLDLDADFIKNHPNYSKILCLGSYEDIPSSKAA